MNITNEELQSLIKEAKQTEELSLTCKGMTNEELKDILKQLPDLIRLYVGGNNLTELDLSNTTKLKVLSVAKNNLTELDFSNTTELTTLFASQNNLTALDMSNNTELKFLHVYKNNLTELDLSNNTELEELNRKDNFNLIKYTGCGNEELDAPVEKMVEKNKQAVDELIDALDEATNIDVVVSKSILDKVEQRKHAIAINYGDGKLSSLEAEIEEIKISILESSIGSEVQFNNEKSLLQKKK